MRFLLNPNFEGSPETKTDGPFEEPSCVGLSLCNLVCNQKVDFGDINRTLPGISILQNPFTINVAYTFFGISCKRA